MRKNSIVAFQWIVTLLQKYHIPFQITGGLAAQAYGSKRELADIDIDLPEDRLADLLPEVKDFATFGPAQFQDEHWDLQLLTLEYQGQEIDLGGAYQTKIFCAKKKEWVPCPSDFSKSIQKIVFGFKVPIISKEELIQYKTMLGRDVDKVDLAALSDSGSR